MSEHDEAMPACITCRPRGGGMSFPSRKPFLQGSWTTAEGDDGTLYVRADLMREAMERALELLEPFADPGLSLGLGDDALTPLREVIAKLKEARP